MHWLRHPPYLRWIAAAALVIGAFWWDSRGDAVSPHPFASVPISIGDPIDSASVEWLEVPAGLLSLPDLDGAVAAAQILPGEPVLASHLGEQVTAPSGWWKIPVAIGGHARPGDIVSLVAGTPPITTQGLVISAQAGDRFSLDFQPAVVAVPPELAGAVAAAAQQGNVVAAVVG